MRTKWLSLLLLVANSALAQNLGGNGPVKHTVPINIGLTVLGLVILAGIVFYLLFHNPRR